MIKPNFKLLLAIKEKGMTQRDFSRLVEDNEAYVSRIINGIMNPDPQRKMRYAKVLGRKVKELLEGNKI